MAENAVLAVVAAEVARRGQSMLTIGAIAGQAGVCKATVRSAIRQADCSHFTVEDRPREVLAALHDFLP